MAHHEQKRLADDLVADFARQRPMRAGSFIITVFGDAVAPRGGRVALASLIDLLAAVGISETLVRTAVSRLVQDGWLHATRHGRRSFYSLTDSGRRRFDEATERIYAGAPVGWDGRWRIVLLPGLDSEAREPLRKELGWIGFGQLAAGVMIHPTAEVKAVHDVVADCGLADSAILLQAEPGLAPAAALERLVASCWNLDELACAYQGFLDRFGAFAVAFEGGNRLGGLDSLLVRLLLIHEYRRIILRDPMLPMALLPGDWIGRDAYRLCRDIYRAVVTASEEWLSGHLEDVDGPLPPPDASFARRFGGLAPGRARTADPCSA